MKFGGFLLHNFDADFKVDEYDGWSSTDEEEEEEEEEVKIEAAEVEKNEKGSKRKKSDVRQETDDDEESANVEDDSTNEVENQVNTDRVDAVEETEIDAVSSLKTMESDGQDKDGQKDLGISKREERDHADHQMTPTGGEISECSAREEPQLAEELGEVGLDDSDGEECGVEAVTTESYSSTPTTTGEAGSDETEEKTLAAESAHTVALDASICHLDKTTDSSESFMKAATDALDSAATVTEGYSECPELPPGYAEELPRDDDIKNEDAAASSVGSENPEVPVNEEEFALDSPTALAMDCFLSSKETDEEKDSSVGSEVPELPPGYEPDLPTDRKEEGEDRGKINHLCLMIVFVRLRLFLIVSQSWVDFGATGGELRPFVRDRVESIPSEMNKKSKTKRATAKTLMGSPRLTRSTNEDSDTGAVLATPSACEDAMDEEREQQARKETERMPSEHADTEDGEQMEKKRREQQERERENEDREREEKQEREQPERMEREKEERVQAEREEREQQERARQEKAEREQQEKEQREREERERQEKEEQEREERLERENRERQERLEREKEEKEQLERAEKERQEREEKERQEKAMLRGLLNPTGKKGGGRYSMGL